MRKFACGVAGVALVLPLVVLALPAGARTSATTGHGSRSLLNASEAKALSHHVTDKVIIVLKDEPPAAPPADRRPPSAPVSSPRPRPRSSPNSTRRRRPRSTPTPWSTPSRPPSRPARPAAWPTIRRCGRSSPTCSVRGPGRGRTLQHPGGKDAAPADHPAPHPARRLSGQGPAGASGRRAVAHQCRQQLHLGTDGPVSRLHRGGGEGGLHRRRSRHQRPRLHPGRRQPRLRRLPGLQW